MEHSPLRGEAMSGIMNGASPRFLWGLVILLLLVTGLYAAIFFFHGIVLVLYPYDVDNSEAYLAYQGARLAQGEGLYQPMEEMPYLVDNYPPVYALFLALGYVFGGVNFHWARFLSFSSTILTAVLLGYWVALMVKNRMAALLTMLAYLSFYHVYDWGALARVDALGLLFGIGGIVLFLRSGSWTYALPLVLLALFTRQTFFAAPLAILFSLFASERRGAGLRFGLALLGTGLVFFLLLMAMTSGRAFTHLVTYNANEYLLSDLWIYTRHWFFLYPVWGSVPLLLLATSRWRSSESESSQQILLTYFTLFALLEAALCGKIGSAPNYLLTLACATSVGVGCLFARLMEISKISVEKETRAMASPIVLFVLVSLVQQLNVFHWPYVRDWALTPTQELTRTGQAVQLALQRTEGPVLSDRAGIPLVAGHDPVFEPFICTQLAKQGLWEQSLLLQRIEGSEFTIVLLQFDLNAPDWDRKRFTSEMIASLQKHYMLERRIGPYFLYRPVSN